MPLLWTKSRENRVICLLNCLMGNHALFHKELWDWLLKMTHEDPLGNLMKSAMEEVNNRFKSVESSEIEEETFRDNLPEGYTYPSPSKDPQRKLLLNPSARVKNSNCPFQIVIKRKRCNDVF